MHTLRGDDKDKCKHEGTSKQGETYGVVGVFWVGVGKGVVLLFMSLSL